MYPGVLLTEVTLTEKDHLLSFKLLAEEFLVVSDGENEQVIRDGEQVVGVSSRYWVVGPTGGSSLVNISAKLAKTGPFYFIDHWG